MERTVSTVYLVGPEDKQLLASVATMRLPCQHFETLEEFLANTTSDSSGCVIANLQLFGIGGFDVLLQLANCRSTLPVIIISSQVSTRMVVRAMREGASTILESPANNEDLFFAVRDAMRENEERMQKERQAASLRDRFGNLSSGEQQVLDQLCSGLNNKDIAEYLDVHVRTVEARKKRLLEKTQSDSIAQLLISYQHFRNTCREAVAFPSSVGIDEATPFGRPLDTAPHIAKSSKWSMTNQLMG